MNTHYEVIIIGGSYSGLSAAMALGRALRTVLIVDANRPCNRTAPHSHNFLTHDGETPAAIAAQAKEQVLAYPTVSFVNDTAITAYKKEGLFTVETEGGKTFTAQKMILATGVKDILPEIDGLAACWGISAIHCPYCHGYEVSNTRTAILANAEAAYHYSQLLLQWTKSLTLYTNGPSLLTPEQAGKLKSHDIAIIETKIERLLHNNGQLNAIALTDGSADSFDALYVRPLFEHHTTLYAQLGCALNDAGYIKTDEMQKTSVSGVYACGDCTTGQRAVAVAVAAGMGAGAALNYEMALQVF